MIALTGASGFVGGRLLERLHSLGKEVRCLTRSPERFSKPHAFHADVLDVHTLRPALEGAEIAYYLVHAIGDADGFADTEAEGAANFATAAVDAGLGRIIYLGGLARGDQLSDHMKSRQEVGRLLASTGVPVVEFRASVVIGVGSLSYELMRELIRAPLIVLPSWADTLSQPIGIDDLVEYLVRAAEEDVEAGVFEIGGAEQISYRDLVAACAEAAGAPRPTLRIPLPAPLFEMEDVPSLLTRLIPERGRAALKLLESLQNASTVSNTRADVFGVEPRGIREVLRLALDDELRAQEE